MKRKAPGVFRKGKRSEDVDDDEEENDYEKTIYTLGNKVYFYEAIEAASILHLKKLIFDLERELRDESGRFGFEPHIELHLYSYGGDVFMGLDMYRCISNSKIPIDTYVDGMIASAATFLFLGGRRRRISEYGHILIHQLSTDFWGKYEDLKDEYDNSKALMACIKDLYEKTSRMPRTKLNQILKRELYLTSADCIKYEIAHEVY